MSKTKQTEKTVAQKPAETELSEAALAQAAGGSFSWGMQDIHFVSGTPKPGELLPAVQKTQN